MKSLILSCWLLLFTAYLAEQSVIPFISADLRTTASSDGPFSQLNQADPLSAFFLLPTAKQHPVPVPVIREPFLKWKFTQSEQIRQLFSPYSGNPEFIQDIWRCPTVAFVLFPFHEFL